MKQYPHPPKLGTYLLRKIYGAALFDEIHGDLLEIYMERLSEKGKFYATLHYMIDALLSIRNYDLRKRPSTSQGNFTVMLSNYLTITLRNIAKHKVYSGLNILGLALGIAASLFILQYVSYERSYDTFHERHEDLYRVRYKVYRGNELNIDCAAAVPRVGPFMKETMPEVKAFARAFPIAGIISHKNQPFREERIHFADPAFLQIFTYPLIAGDAETALTQPNTLVITESIAKKFFGFEDPVGKMLRFDGDNNVSLPALEITAVVEDVPHNSHFKFDYLISYETLNNFTQNEDGNSPSETSWGWYDFNTYVLLEPGTDKAEFDARFDKELYADRGKDFEENNFRLAFPLQPITDIHLYSNLLQESEPEEQGDGQAVFFLIIIAFFILLIAWINYINLSTSRSIERAKEVGVRKTLGAYKQQLISQFLTESFVLNFLALALGLVIVALGIRYFNQLTDSQLSLAFLQDSQFWIVSITIFLTGALLAGLYPAFILSAFNPARVIKGKPSSKAFGNQLRRGLVVFQFAASIALIAGTIVVYQQLAHMQDADLGFDMTETLVLKGPDVLQVDSLHKSIVKTFKAELRAQPDISEVSASSNIPGEEIFWTNGIKRTEAGDETGRVIYIAGVDYDFFPTYDIAVIAGRNYRQGNTTDGDALILNKAAVGFLGFDSPEAAVGKKVTFWGKEREILGIVADYNQMSVKAPVAPIAFPLVNGSTFFTVKLKTSSSPQTLAQIRSQYEGLFPGNPVEYFFLDEFYNRQYNNEHKFSRVFTLFAGFAIFVACLGLFGLSSYSALKRSKEIGIRKVLGANEKSIVLMLSREFILLVIIANVIAWPIMYRIMNHWLENFATRITIGFPVFLVSGLLVVLIAILTVSYKTIRVARTNPVHVLKDE